MSNGFNAGTYLTVQNTSAHNFRMEYDIPELLKKMMEVIPGKQAGLAKRLGGKISQSVISRWLDGVEPKGKNYERIIGVAHETGIIGDIRSEDVAASLDKPPRHMVKVKGYVGAGSQAHYYAVDPGDLGEIEGDDKTTDQTLALVIIGKSLGKFFDHWYVFYDDVRSPITEDLIGELCVVGLADDRVLIKKIRRNGTAFDLISNAESEAPIKNVKIEWAAKVKNIAPQ